MVYLLTFMEYSYLLTVGKIGKRRARENFYHSNFLLPSLGILFCSSFINESIHIVTIMTELYYRYLETFQLAYKNGQYWIDYIIKAIIPQPPCSG